MNIAPDVLTVPSPIHFFLLTAIRDTLPAVEVAITMAYPFKVECRVEFQPSQEDLSTVIGYKFYVYIRCGYTNYTRVTDVSYGDVFTHHESNSLSELIYEAYDVKLQEVAAREHKRA